ncbi:MAG: STAS domain-containing protein [Leptospirales bacterium]|nr:STAS domain-containing protein [Leptospirales bacterium]
MITKCTTVFFSVTVDALNRRIEQMMDVHVHSERGIHFLNVTGRVDYQTVDSLQNAFEKSLQSGRTRIVLNLADALLIDSSGISTMIRALMRARSYGGDVKLAGMRDNLLSLFHTSSLQVTFEIYPSNEAAASAFPA